MKFKRPVKDEFPISAVYGKWGPWWGFHMTSAGTWIPGKVDGMGQHKGIDFATPVGSEVLAVADGFIYAAGWENHLNPKQGFGMRARQEVTVGGKKRTVVYGHMSVLTVQAGHQVAKGDRIGYSGDTGKVTGPHLHIELTDGNGQYFPMEFEETPQKPLENPPEAA